jgi:hypothetical protein
MDAAEGGRYGHESASPRRMSRRGFLRLLFAGGVVVAGAGGVARRLAVPADALESLRALLPVNAGVRRLGRVRRGMLAGEDAGTRLVRRLAHGRAPIRWRNAVADAVAGEFRNGHVVAVDGWLLSETQADLCALAEQPR